MTPSPTVGARPGRKVQSARTVSEVGPPAQQIWLAPGASPEQLWKAAGVAVSHSSICCRPAHGLLQTPCMLVPTSGRCHAPAAPGAFVQGVLKAAALRAGPSTALQAEAAA